ncbi:hypothetical protein J6590_029871 [Homalodisca vitripennis]|nr:hypothetical protein J6590_029871 [Homalodisca vitripennis]
MLLQNVDRWRRQGCPHDGHGPMTLLMSSLSYKDPRLRQRSVSHTEVLPAAASPHPTMVAYKVQCPLHGTVVHACLS